MPELKAALEKYGDVHDTNIGGSVEGLCELPKLFGGEEVFDRADKLFKDEKLINVLKDMKQAYKYLCGLGFKDKITVDFGLVNKANYYTGLLFRGYIHGFGMPVLSGGRYDALTGDFGFSHPATGFAVNINAVAKALLKNNSEPLTIPSEVLVYSETAERGFARCRELVGSGVRAENSLNESLEEAKEFARKKRIKTVDVVDSDGTVTKIDIQSDTHIY